MSLVRPINTAFCLEKICESNFQKLFSLIPDLCLFQNLAIGRTKNKPPIYLKVVDRSKHTITVELSHHFEQQESEKIVEPALLVRIYLDANLAEVIKHHAKTTVSRIYSDPGKTTEIMHYKWRLNYFLQKWLDHCLQKKYQFQGSD